jgi:autotransporter-associated beta strand protein
VRFFIVVLGFVLWAVSSNAATATIFTYPLPSIYTNSQCYSLSINGTNIPVVNYTAQYDYAEFSMSDGIASVQVTASTQSAITSYGISPLKFGLTGTINSNTLTFSFTNNQYLIISINGMKPFALCADPAESVIPPSSGSNIFNVVTSYGADKTGSNLTSSAIQSAINAASTYGGTNVQGIVFVPAGVYLCGNLQLQNNMALYLQGGAVIRCTGIQADYISGGYRGSYDGIVSNGTKFIYANNTVNSKIYGRGTVDGNGNYMALTNNYGDNLLIPNNCTNFTADGIIFRDSGGWAIVPTQSTNMTLSNLKIFDYMTAGQDDCIDVDDSQNLVVSNVFGISGDDTLSTKSYNYPITNILFENGLLWSEAIGCKIGWEVYTPQEDITFSNIVVYNCQQGIGLTENNGGPSGGSTVQNLTFENIDIENNTNGNAVQETWGIFEMETTNGLATNVMVSNITVRQTGLNGSIGGLYTNAIVDGITFSNIFMFGSNTPASNLFQMDIFDQRFYTNLTILPTNTPLPAVYLTADDPDGSTSFNQPGNWSSDQAPASTNNYVVGAFTLRTPTSGTQTFKGGSLSLYNEATLSLKNDNSTTTIGSNTNTGLFINNSYVKNVDTANDTLAGYVTLLQDGAVFRMPAGIGYTFTVSAVIGGEGAFQAGGSSDAGTIKLTGVNTYTGGTLFGTSLSDTLTLQLSGSGTLGSTNGSLAFNSTNDIVDLNGTKQGIGNLSGTAGIITNSSSSAASLTMGNGDNGGGIFYGSIVAGGGNIVLKKVGSGTIAFSGTNTYAGGTAISNGTVQLGSPNDTAVLTELLGTGGITNLGNLNLTSFEGITISNIISGSGSLTVASGTNTLTATNTYTGSTTVSAGMLALSGFGSISNSSKISLSSGAILNVNTRNDNTLSLNNGQTLTGSGNINGSLNVLGGATVIPGNIMSNSIGTLTVQSNVTLNGSLLLKLDRTNSQNSDKLVSTAGHFTTGGSLTVTNVGPSLQTGDTFQLFGAAVNGFSSPILPTLSLGLGWTNKLAVNGTIQVETLVAINPTNITFQTTAGGLIMNWPSDHTGWWLQEETNLLGSNWVNVAGSSTTNQVTIPFSPAQPANFFRLVYP